MKNKLFDLYKITLFNNYNIKRKVGKANSISGIITTIIIYALLCIFSCVYAITGFYILKERNVENYLPLIFYTITLLVTFTLTINKAKSTIFDSRYNDLLFSMPFKPKTILASRILTLLTMNYITVLIIMAPAFLIFGILSKMSIAYYLMSIGIIAFTPFLPVTLASLVGFFIAMLSSNVKVGKKIFEIIITFVFFGILMLLYSFSTKFFELFISNIDKVDLFLNKYGFVIKYINEALAYHNIVSFAKFILVNLVLITILIWSLSLGFFKITSKLGENESQKSKTKTSKYIKKSTLKSLTIKELKNMLGIPTYVFNSLFGVVILFIASIALFFISKENVFNMVQIGPIDVKEYLPLYLLNAIIFIVGMSNTTCCSISLEGKKFWITKSLPIRTKSILDSKIITNIITVSIPTTISIILICINFKISIIATIGILLVSLILNVMVAEFGILINLAFPKLTYESDIQVVKQSASTFISIFSMMIISVLIIIGVLVIGVLFGINITIFSVLLLFLFIAAIERVIINKFGIRKFEKISN